MPNSGGKQPKPEKYTTYKAKGYINEDYKEFIVVCPDCGSDWLKMNGFNRECEQMFKCKECNRNFPILANYRKIRNIKEGELQLNRIAYLHQKGYSANAIANELGVHTSTITKYIDLVESLIYAQLQEAVEILEEQLDADILNKE